MNKTNFVIYSEDSAYAHKWANYLRDNSYVPPGARVFTSFAGLQQFSKKTTIDILIYDEKPLEDLSEISASVKIALVSAGPAVTEQGPPVYYVYKYSSADDIMKSVFEICAGENQAFLKGKKSSERRIIGVYSPLGRCGKTLFAAAAAAALSKEEETLYLNLEQYSALSLIFGDTPASSISDLLFYFRQNPDMLPEKLLTLSGNAGKLKFFSGPNNIKDLWELDPECFGEFLDKIISSGFSKNIVIDFQTSLPDAANMLKLCDEIYIPTKEDLVSQEKLRIFSDKVISSSTDLEAKAVFTDLSDYISELDSVRLISLSSSRLGEAAAKIIQNGGDMNFDV